jgi:hypothetical protein
MNFTSVIHRSGDVRFCETVVSSVAQTLSTLGYLSALGSISGQVNLVAAAEVAFRDRNRALVAGSLSLAFDSAAIAALASTMLARGEGVALTAEELDDATLELVNVAAGNLLSQLFGTQREFSLSLPRLGRVPARLDAPWLGLRCESGSIGICFSMD